MRDSLALVATQSEKCYLLKYGDREWNVENIFFLPIPVNIAGSAVWQLPTITPSSEE